MCILNEMISGKCRELVTLSNGVIEEEFNKGQCLRKAVRDGAAPQN